MRIGFHGRGREDRGRRAPSQPPDTEATILCDAGVPDRELRAGGAAE